MSEEIRKLTTNLDSLTTPERKLLLLMLGFDDTDRHYAKFDAAEVRMATGEVSSTRCPYWHVTYDSCDICREAWEATYGQ